MDKKASAEALKYLTESFMLVMPFNSTTIIPIPTTIEFAVEALINKDIFTQQTIKEEYLNSKSSNLHVTPRTRDISIQISNYIAWLESFGQDPDKVQDRKIGFVPTDPVTIDLLLSNFMVGIYRYPLEAFDALAKDVDKYGEIETKKKDEIDILREPWNILIKRNIEELPADSTTHTQIFFELIQYPFLDKNVVQEFLWLKPELKNSQYKSVIDNYFMKNNFSFSRGKKIGF